MSPRYIAKFPFFNSNTWRHGSTLFDLNGQKLAYVFFSFFRDQLTSPSSICYDCLRYCGFDPVSIISNLKIKGQTAIFKEHWKAWNSQKPTPPSTFFSLAQRTWKLLGEKAKVWNSHYSLLPFPLLSLFFFFQLHLGHLTSSKTMPNWISYPIENRWSSKCSEHLIALPLSC